MEKRTTWYFTFGSSHYPGHNYYTRIRGTFQEARELMFSKFGPRWAFQYSFKEGRSMAKEPQIYLFQPLKYFSFYKYNKES